MLTPACTSSRMSSIPSVAGPRVARILTFLSGVIFCALENQDGAEVVDVGAGRLGDDQRVERCEIAVAIVVVEFIAGAQTEGGGAGVAVRGHDRPGIVFGAVDAIGIAGQRVDAGQAFEAVGQAQEELGIAPAATIAAHGDRGFTARKDHARRRQWLAMQDHLPRDAGVNLGHLAGFAFQIAEDQRTETGLTGFHCSGFKRLLRAGDQLEMTARQARVAGFDRLRFRALQPVAHRRRDFNVVALEDRQRFGGGARVGDGGAGGDDRGEVARYIGNRIGINSGGPAGFAETAALDRREVLAHAVHLADGRAGFEQGFVDRLLVGERNPLGRKGEQRRSATGEQEDDAVVFAQVADQIQHALGDGQAGGVGHRVSGFDDFDFFARGAVTVTRHHQAGHFTLPAALDHLGHGGGSFASADDDHATTAVSGQMSFEDLLRMGRVNGCGKQLTQELLRIDRHGGLPDFLVIRGKLFAPVGARLAREPDTTVFLLHRGAPFAGKPRSYREQWLTAYRESRNSPCAPGL
ncbi:hypothetical protein EMIT0P44_290082 [Pseudomonas sp. IT-P44]